MKKLQCLIQYPIIGILICQGALAAQAAQTAELWKNPALPVEARADALIKEMTLEEKIKLLGNGFRLGNRRLGIPAMTLADGPLGLSRGNKPAIAYPAIVELAATFNPELARAHGEALGKNGRSRGFHVFLGPGVNIHRIPISGRNFEYFSEDPFLTARLVVPYIQGVRSQGVLATVKHFIGNDQEYNRYYTDSQVDERTLHEIYYPPFRAALQEGGAECIMTGHNKLNGEWCAANRGLLTDLLRGQWGFQGIAMSDWNGRHDGVAAVQAGLNFDAPEGRKVNMDTLKPALDSGAVTEAQIDVLLRGILQTEIRAGFFDRPQLDPTQPENDPACAQVALDIAREGIVLLKNEPAMLPLNKTVIKKVAIIGPNAEPLVISGGGSARVDAFATTSLPEAIRRDPACRFEMIINTDDLLDEFCAQSIFSHLDDQGNRVAGLKASYYEKEYWQGAIKQAVVAGINGDASRELPPGMDTKAFSVKWTGQITPAETADYAFITSGYNRMDILLNGTPLIIWRGSNYIRSHRRDMPLEAGKTYNLEIRYSKRTPISPIVHFGWGRADQIGKGSLVEKIAAGADVVIACVGYGPQSEGEGMDRTWRLPGMQRELLDLVTSANNNTIIIANAGHAFETESWLKKVPAFLHAFYSGQEGGQALKEIIFGETNPSGKLPFTFGKTLKDYPTMATYNDRALEIPYTEGVFVGYRGFDREGREPLFAFGAGLSYTTFALSDMKSSPVDGQPGRVRIDCKVRNTGTRPGAETVQLYIGERNPTVPRPVRELKGFRKIALQPGESAAVEFLLDRADFGFYDAAGKCWKTNPGEYEISLGHSSQKLPLHETYLLK